MKIRNLQQYIHERCSRDSKDSLRLLFTDDEPFLYEILGDGGSVENMVSRCASFAKDAEQQVFYEFVQNAFDAEGDSVFFYTGTVDNQDFLLVLNNGKPFYTDKKVTDKSKKREGQLFSFLNKGKSDKPNEPSIGKFGQGSKLLYTLLPDINKETTLADLMAPSLIEERQAPYLISWDKGEQLDNFLMDRNIWDRDFGYANEEFLIAKIFCCYYPLEPGVDETLFSNEEVSRLVRVFNELVDPKRNLNRLQGSGTALIIPLGKGKRDLLLEPARVGKVKSCLAPFASIIGNYKEFAGKHLSRIVFLGEGIKPIEAQSVCIEITKGNNKKYKYQFVFDKSLIHENCVNLYKALPISDAVYGLNFIIDSQDLPVDDSRQNINEVDVAIHNITEAMKVFIKEFDSLKISDKKKYDYIYDCLMKARPNNVVVKAPFDEVIRPYLQQNVRRVDGTYGELESTVVIKNKLNIPFDQIGVSGIYVAADNVVTDYGGLGMPIENISLEKIIEKADEEKMAGWIKKLTKDAYAAYHQEVVKIVKNKPARKLLRTNYGHVVSYNQVCDQQNFVYYIDVAPFVFQDFDLVEYIELPLTNTALPSSYIGRIIEKIKNQASSLTRERVEFACALLKELNDANYLTKIRQEIALLENCKGEKKSFYDLFKARPNNTVLYEKFVVKAPLPQQTDDSWFVSCSEVWGWLKRNWTEVKQLDDWKEYHDSYLSDIKKAWNPNTDRSALTLWLNEDGEPVEDKQVLIKGTCNASFSEEDYSTLKNVFKAYSLVPYKFRMELNASCFEIEKVDLADLIPQTGTIELTPNELRVIIGVTNSFWDKYIVTEQNEGNYTVQKMPFGGKNYTYGYELSSEEESNLKRAKFYRIPKSIKFTEEEYQIDKALLKEVIACVPQKKLLFNILKKNQYPENIKRFSEVVEPLEFSTGSDIDELSLDCSIVDWYSDKEEALKDNIWKRIVVDGKSLPMGKLCPNKVVVGEHQYNAYELAKVLEKEDALVKSLLDKLPQSLHFESKYCAKRRNTIEPAELMKLLNANDLSVKQLEFALDYWATEKGAIVPDLYLSKEVSLEDALDMVAKREFKHFYRKFQIVGLDTHCQIYAPEGLLLEKERLPQTVYNWISRDEKRLSLFGESRLYKNHALIKLRKAFVGNESCHDIGDKQENDTWILENTFQWLIKLQAENKINFIRDSKAIENMHLLQDWMETDCIYLLKYTTELWQGQITYKLTQPNVNKVKFMANDTYIDKLLKFITDQNAGLVNYLTENDIFLPLHTKDLMRKYSLGNKSMVVITYESQHDENWKEWEDAVYKKWLEKPESKNIHIFVSSQEINSTLRLTEDGICKLELPMSQGEMYGISKDEKGHLIEVAVKFPNGLDKNIYKALECQVVPYVERFREPFIALQGMKIDEADEQDKEKNELAQKIDAEALKILSQNQFDLRQLELLVAGKLHEGTGNGNGTGEGNGGFGGGTYVSEDKDEKEEETKMNKISGYIGELLYKGYLEHTHKIYCWDAQDKNEGRYDFCIENERYVEIKTNVRTIMNGDSPLYLHKSQVEFLHTIDTNNYYVCRLSIEDLGLMDEYRAIRNIYGINTDPKSSENLRIDCQSLAESYWQLIGSVELFEKMRRVYRIKDIFLENNSNELM